MIALSDLTRIAADCNVVSFADRPGEFFIDEATRCQGPNCRLSAGEPCAGVVTLALVDDQDTLIRDVHIGATGTYRAVSA